MDRRMLTEEPWSRIADNRLFVEAVLYIARTGCPWRDMLKVQIGERKIKNIIYCAPEDSIISS